MTIFETIKNDGFFRPLCCKNNALYMECIDQLIETSKTIPILYETDARNTIIMFLQNCQYAIETEDIGIEINKNKTASDNAAAIINYFRKCGWITQKEIGRNGDNIASITPYCRKVVEALHRIFDNGVNGSITNHIFSIYEILKSSSTNESLRTIRPYTNIMHPLIENECDLKNELFILKDSIREIMRIVIKMSDANSFGKFLMRDEVLKRFFSDYFFIKQNGLIPSYLSDIDAMLTEMHHSDIYKKMIEEYQELKKYSFDQAKSIIDKQMNELKFFINVEYDKEMSQIDRKINIYYNLYSTRLLMVLSNNTNLQHYLNNILMQLKHLDNDIRTEFLQELASCMRVMKLNFVNKKSFERRKKKKANTINTGVNTEELSDEEKQRLTDEVLSKFPERYSVENVKEYFEQRIASQQILELESFHIQTRDDAMMMAASVIYSGSADFPFEVTFYDEMIKTDIADMKKISIRRK